MRRQPEPRADVLNGGERVHVRAHLREDRLGDGRRAPCHGHESHAGEARARRAGIVAGLLLRRRARPDAGPGRGRRVPRQAGLHSGNLPLDRGIPGGHWGLVAVEELERLLQNAHLHVAPRAGEGFGEVVFRGLPGRLASLGQRQWSALAVQDRSQERLDGHAREIREAPRATACASV
jgi:hypothetical protein